MPPKAPKGISGLPELSGLRLSVSLDLELLNNAEPPVFAPEKPQVLQKRILYLKGCIFASKVFGTNMN